MEVYKDFFLYRDGVYSKSDFAGSKPLGFHSVKIVGWGEENKNPYWVIMKIHTYYITSMKKKYNVITFQKIANSWGQDWGQTGYFKIRRGINECLIESFVIGAWAQTDKHLKQLRQFRMRQRMGRSKRNFKNRSNNHNHRRRHFKKP